MVRKRTCLYKSQYNSKQIFGKFIIVLFMYRLFVIPRGFVSFLGSRDTGLDSRELKVTTIPKKALLVISARG